MKRKPSWTIIMTTPRFNNAHGPAERKKGKGVGFLMDGHVFAKAFLGTHLGSIHSKKERPILDPFTKTNDQKANNNHLYMAVAATVVGWQERETSIICPTRSSSAYTQ